MSKEKVIIVNLKMNTFLWATEKIYYTPNLLQ